MSNICNQSSRVGIKVVSATLALSIVLAIDCCLTIAQENLSQAIEAVNSVDVNGHGHAEAVAAMKVLNQAEPSDIPELLEAMDNLNKVSINWLRGAIQSALGKDGNLPTDQVKAYFDDSSHSDLGRLLAFELMTKDNDSAAEIIPELADDPSLPLRRMAIAHFIDQAKETKGAESIGQLGFALDKARDLDQVQTIVAMLAKRGVSIDTQKQVGFVNSWHIVGPFDNTDEKGFDVAYGPEKNPGEIDLEATYSDSKSGDELKWEKTSSVERTAEVDLNELLGNEKFATAYAYSTFNSDKEQEVEIRIGCINANKVWVNGELIISNEIYHVGMQPDQFVGKAKLSEGENHILFKVSQNDQKQPWAQRWQFQLRICDALGKAIHPAPPEQEQE